MSSGPQRYAFRAFVLDVRERRLLNDGKPVPMQAKVFATLELLVRNAGRLVTKGELFAVVWPDVHVGESSLNHNISVIRKTLWDPAIIETVPKAGYRFAAEVRVLDVPAAPPARFRGRRDFAMAAVLLTAAIARHRRR